MKTKMSNRSRRRQGDDAAPVEVRSEVSDLRIEVEALHTGLGNDLLELVRKGDVSKCSFKFSVDKDSWQYADEDNGMEYDERTVEHISHLYDVSLVYPAYRDTEASVRQLEEWMSHRDSAVDTSFRDRTVQFLNLKNRNI